VKEPPSPWHLWRVMMFMIMLMSTLRGVLEQQHLYIGTGGGGHALFGFDVLYPQSYF
jgi:hypothetical protein